MAVKAKPAPKKSTASKAKVNARLATVPEAVYFDSYIGRNVSPGVSEFDVFAYAQSENMNVLIEGPTGPGKTSAVMAYAAREQMPFYAIPSNIGIEPSQLFGKYIPSEDGGFHWVDGPVTDIVRHGGVLLINEVNFIPERVATVLFGLLDKRRQITLLDHEAETITAHDDLLVMADMNPDYEGTRPLNKAFRNRFALQLWWDYDDKVERSLVKCAALRDMAKKLRNEQKAGTYDTPCSTNMLMEFERVYGALGYDFAKSNFINHFASEERQAVGVVIETYRANIEAGLNPEPKGKKKAAPGGAAEGAFGETRAELEAMVDSSRGQSVQETDDGLVLSDPEWGIRGVHWLWEDDTISLPGEDTEEVL